MFDNKVLTLIFVFLLTILVVSCFDDNNHLLYSGKCQVMTKTVLGNSMFDSSSYPSLHNEFIQYKNDGSNKSPGSSFIDSILDSESNVLQAYGAIQNNSYCMPVVDGIGIGRITYALESSPKDLIHLGTFSMSDCSFNHLEGDEYHFHTRFLVNKNSDLPEDMKAVAKKIKDSGVIEFTCHQTQ